MFMILSRSSKNLLGLSGFVKKSARLASLRTKGKQRRCASMERTRRQTTQGRRR